MGSVHIETSHELERGLLLATKKLEQDGEAEMFPKDNREIGGFRRVQEGGGREGDRKSCQSLSDKI